MKRLITRDKARRGNELGNLRERHYEDSSQADKHWNGKRLKLDAGWIPRHADISYRIPVLRVVSEMYYAYLHLIRGVPIYAGKGIRDRAFSVWSNRNPEITRTYRAMGEVSEELEVLIWDCVSEIDAYRIEYALVRSIGLAREGGTLLNQVVPEDPDAEDWRGFGYGFVPGGYREP